MKLFQRAEVWEIGPFQLENVVTNMSGYLLFDLSGSDLASEDAAVAQVLSSRIPVDLKDLEQVVAARAINLGHPMVLLCTEGEQSPKAARRLMALNYTNVYVVAGGLRAVRDYFADTN